MVALEAMQSGAPIFASDAGPMREIVQDRVSGRLFPGASPEQMAAEIASITDAELRRFGEAGRRIFRDRFTAERMGRDMLDEYESVLGKVVASGPKLTQTPSHSRDVLCPEGTVLRRELSFQSPRKGDKVKRK